MGVLALNLLPVGFRFSPTDEELVNHYLKGKIKGDVSKVEAISEVEICGWEPWDLPRLSVIKNNDPEWFFFCPINRKYPKGRRSHRATKAGYWKATGKDRCVKTRSSSGMKPIGMKKTLVFHKGRAPGGTKTDWIMHEYRTNSEEDAYVLCRLFNKEKAEGSNCDEIEPTGSSPTATNSSLECMPASDLALVPATSESGLQAGEQHTSVDRWLADKEQTIFTTQLADDSHCNSGKASEVEDHGGEVDLDECLRFFSDPANDLTDLPTCGNDISNGAGYGSPFANDFGYAPMPIQYGANNNELDMFDPQFLDTLLYGFNDESSSQKYGVAQGGEFHMLQTVTTESEFGKDSVSCSDTDNEVLQQASSELETSPWSTQYVDIKDLGLSERQMALQSRTETSYIDNTWKEKMDMVRVESALLDAYSADSARSFYALEPKAHINPEDTSVETGIKLKSRQPIHRPSSNHVEPGSHNLVAQSGQIMGQLSSQKHVAQGSAKRRIHLQVYSAEDDEGKAVIAEAVGEVTEDATTIAPQEPRAIGSGLGRVREEDSSTEPVLCVEMEAKYTSRRISATPCVKATYSGYYMVLVALVIVLVALFFRVWQCSIN